MKNRLQKQKISHYGNLDYAAAGAGLAEAAAVYGRTSRSFKRVLVLGLAAFACVGGAFAVTGQETVKAAACAAPAVDYGTDTLTVDVAEANTYTVWVRMAVTDAANNSINLQVDGTTCFNVGGGTFAATTWADNASNWVNYTDGTAAAVMQVQLTKGAHAFKFIGTKPGVMVDKIIITTNNKLTPSGVCNDCLAGDSTPPTVNLTPPQQTVDVLGTLPLQVTAADASGVAKVDFLLDNEVVYTDATAPYSFDFNTAAVQNGAHTIKAQATDTEGNTAATAATTITTKNIVVCTGNPSIPANLRVSGVSGTTVSLAWDASTPGAQCQLKGYRIFRDGVQVSTAQGTTFTDVGLNPGSPHVYTVAAVDLSNNLSEKSAPATGTTATDNVAPSVPANVRTSLVTNNSVVLAWTASTDNNAVASYVIYRNGVQIGTSNGNAYTDGTVEPNKDYAYTVAAKDTANNLSAQSQQVAVKTLAGQAESSKIFITPPNSTVNMATGATFTVEIHVNSNGTPVNAAQADITYTPNLEFVGIDDGGSAYDVSAVKQGGNGTITIARGSLNAGPLTGDKLLAKITFKALAAGAAKVDVLDSSIALSAATNTDVINTREDGNYTIINQAPATPTTPAPATNSGSTKTTSGSSSSGSVSRSSTSSSSSGGKSSTAASSTTPSSTTTIAPVGSSEPVTLPNDTEVELSDPVVVQTTPDSSQETEKVEYYLNGKLIATVKEAPYTYSVNTKNLKNGTYTLTTKTYYKNGDVETKNATLVVKNPMSFRQVMLQLGGLVWVIILLLVMAAGAVWYFYFRNRGGDDDYSDTDGYMFGPNGQVGGPSGDNYGPPTQYSKLLSQFRPILAYDTVESNRY